MASSRIFVKGLPPTFTDAEFRQHFSRTGRDITDAKIFPNRRIGYVGFKTPEDAQSAVKYFNKTFIRMSRIGVELARPVEDAKPPNNGTESKIIEDVSASSGGNKLKRKRDAGRNEEEDPKLKEFLNVMKPKSKKEPWESDHLQAQNEPLAHKDNEAANISEEHSDEEYEFIPKKTKRPNQTSVEVVDHRGVDVDSSLQPSAAEGGADSEHDQQPSAHPDMSDADWARSRTSRLLGLLDEEEEDETAIPARRALSAEASSADEPPQISLHTDLDSTAEAAMPTPPSDDIPTAKENPDSVLEAVGSSMRLFVRNLPYTVTKAELEAEFAPFGNLVEVHIAIDKKTGATKGFAYVEYSDPDSAKQALIDRDGQPFQGRLIHILPAAAKRENKLDDFALSQLPLKKQQEIRRRREAASSTFNWNALYMNADAVVASVADRLGLSKSEVLDPTSSDAAIKQAHAETHIIQETKSYFRQQGVDLDSFKKSQRGDSAILVKNIPYDCSRDELKRLFDEHGETKRFLMPPSGTMAIVEFANVAQCKAAFGALAYRKVKSSVLFLEKAPKDLFAAKPSSETDGGVNKISTSDLKDSESMVPDTAGTATLFVRNLNFSTTTQLLTDTFKTFDGFLSARVKTKTDPKRPNQILSMGFGFIEFRTAKQAQAALQTMDGFSLEGHKLQIRASHKGVDAAEERRKADANQKAANQKTKVIIKNLPFEASKKDVRALFGAYGQLRSVRVPKKMDRAARGFAFADFTTVKEAQNAMDALRDTHLLGRRLILDFAAEDSADAEAEIEKMQQKVGAQVNKVALQKLTSGGRKKFTTQNDEDDV